MKRSDTRIRWCAALLVVNLVLIWGNSLLPGEVSGKLSGVVTEMIGKLFGSDGPPGSGGHGLVRKMAHFTEFACLGMLLLRNLTLDGQRGRNLVTQTLLGGLLTALTDETIQMFVDGRGPSLKDVWIDFAGVTVGMAILYFGHDYVKKRKHTTKTEEQT
jgi:VanZ family protein